MEVTITEIVEDYFSVEKEVSWLKCRTSKNELIAFWGEIDMPNRNIVSLRHQVMPICIYISEPESCIPTPYEKSEYGISYSVPESILVVISSEH